MTMVEAFGAEPEQAGLTFQLNNERPVAVAALAESLSAFSRSYEDFLAGSLPSAADANVRLYVQELRSGSIIAVFEAIADQAQILFGEHGMVRSARYLFDHADTFGPFLTNLNDLITFFRGGPAPKELPTKKEASDLISILEPVAADPRSSLTINAHATNGGTVNVTINHVDANAVQNAARRYVGPKLPANQVLQDEVMILHQMRGEAAAKAGDKGIIETISKLPVKLAFASENIKQAILALPENPFQLAFVVDVDVKTVNEKPALYKILALKDRFDKPA